MLKLARILGVGYSADFWLSYIVKHGGFASFTSTWGRIMPWLHVPIFLTEVLSEIADASKV